MLIGRSTVGSSSGRFGRLAGVGLVMAVGAGLLPCPPASAQPKPLPIGVSYSGWRGGYADAAQRLKSFAAVGFPIVTFVPAYAYVGRNRIALDAGPTSAELGGAVELALRDGRSVVMKPHLEPPNHRPGYKRALSDNHSWRAECGWRGFFDLDPMTADYREGIVFASLRLITEVLDRVPATTTPRVRLDLGAELMNSVVEFPQRWGELLTAAKKERRRLGLEGKVLLSHNFSHHIQIPEDQIDRMDARGRRALGRYIAGLDALALSQYMDLTVVVPAAERANRLPSADEVAEALRVHDRRFRDDILVGKLGLRAKEIPAFHLGEFGIGAAGLKHPNLWGGTRSAEEERALTKEIARGHEGLVKYLASENGRTAGSAVLWVTGPHFDIFGWRNPAWAIPEAKAAIEEALTPAAARP